MKDTSNTSVIADIEEIVDDLLRHKLRHASTDALIQALITLTHRVHGRSDAASDETRLQREYVIDELKRRADLHVPAGVA